MHTVVSAARNQDPDRFNRLPECIEEFLDYGPALSCAFNRPGTLLASEIQPGSERQERQLHTCKTVAAAAVASCGTVCLTAATCCAIAAAGTDNGYVGIWDFETRGLAKTLPPEE